MTYTIKYRIFQNFLENKKMKHFSGSLLQALSDAVDKLESALKGESEGNEDTSANSNLVICEAALILANFCEVVKGGPGADIILFTMQDRLGKEKLIRVDDLRNYLYHTFTIPTEDNKRKELLDNFFSLSHVILSACYGNIIDLKENTLLDAIQMHSGSLSDNNIFMKNDFNNICRAAFGIKDFYDAGMSKDCAYRESQLRFFDFMDLIKSRKSDGLLLDKDEFFASDTLRMDRNRIIIEMLSEMRAEFFNLAEAFSDDCNYDFQIESDKHKKGKKLSKSLGKNEKKGSVKEKRIPSKEELAESRRRMEDERAEFKRRIKESTILKFNNFLVELGQLEKGLSEISGNIDRDCASLKYPETTLMIKSLSCITGADFRDAYNYLNIAVQEKFFNKMLKICDKAAIDLSCLIETEIGNPNNEYLRRGETFLKEIRKLLLNETERGVWVSKPLLIDQEDPYYVTEMSVRLGTIYHAEGPEIYQYHVNDLISAIERQSVGASLSSLTKFVESFLGFENKQGISLFSKTMIEKLHIEENKIKELNKLFEKSFDLEEEPDSKLLSQIFIMACINCYLRFMGNVKRMGIQEPSSIVDTVEEIYRNFGIRSIEAIERDKIDIENMNMLEYLCSRRGVGLVLAYLRHWIEDSHEPGEVLSEEDGFYVTVKKQMDIIRQTLSKDKVKTSGTEEGELVLEGGVRGFTCLYVALIDNKKWLEDFVNAQNLVCLGKEISRRSSIVS